MKLRTLALLCIVLALPTTYADGSAAGPNGDNGGPGSNSKPKPTDEELYQTLGIVVNTTANALCVLNPSLCPTPPSPPGPSPGGAPGPKEYEDLLFYELPTTRFTFPGFQTRTTIDPVYPADFFDQYSQLQITPWTTHTNRSILSPAQINAIRARNDASGIIGAKRRSLLAAPPVPVGQNGGWITLSSDSGVIAIHAIPLSNGQILFMERPGALETPPNIASVYNLNNNSYRRFPMYDDPFCNGHLQLINGQILIVGGDNVHQLAGLSDGRFNVRVFTGGAQPSYRIAAVMPPNPFPNPDPNSGGRWYPSLATMVDGNVLIVGGQSTEGGSYTTPDTYVNPSYLFFQINNQTITSAVYLPLLAQTSPITLYPYITVLPVTGLVMIVSGAVTQFFRYTPGLLTQDTTTYPAIPNLPIPALYPQTANFVLLPLEYPNYTPRILVVGGSTVDRATPETAATANTYLLDLSSPTPTWQVETMSTPRIMPDGVLLPDGTLFICNGADTGIAGGTPGGGAAYNALTGALAGEIYDPRQPFGSRMSGLLATSGRDRLYHSVAWLTRNAEVLVTGSEPTLDYSIQIYTPPYLVGTFRRPIITTPSATSPAYNQVITLVLTYAAGTTAISPITRVVLISTNGITHSTHFDQRSVSCSFTSTAGVLSVQMPPSASVAPPANYMLFAVTADGRPSQAVYIGLGGATPSPLFFEPPVTPLIANGTYSITARSRAGCASGASLGYQTCNVSNDAIISPAVGVWQFNYVSTAYQPQTYDIQAQQRTGSCNTYMGSEPCTESDDVLIFQRDDRSGRQQWTLTAAPGGGYYIQVLIGRNGCASLNTYLTASACGSGTVSLTASASAATVWDIAAVNAPPIVPQQPAVPIIPAGNYYITENSRANCGNILDTQADCSTNAVFADTTGGLFQFAPVAGAIRLNTYNIIAANGRAAACRNLLSCSDCSAPFVDLFDNDDGTGRQRFVLTASAFGGYNFRVRNGRGSCAQFVTAQTCSAGNALTFAATNASPLASFNVTTSITVTPPVAPYFANGLYTLANTERTTCPNLLSVRPCATGDLSVQMNTNGYVQLTLQPNAPFANTYDVTFPQRAACRNFLSAASCPVNGIDQFDSDDASGRQQWAFTLLPNGNYNIQIVQGRDGCASYLASVPCGQTGQLVLFGTSGAAGQYTTWSVTPGTGTPPTSPALQPGQYQIQSVGRASGCANSFLGAQLCSQGRLALMQPGGVWTLTALQNTMSNNTFNVISTSRVAAQCTPANVYLSATSCGIDSVDLFDSDDKSGRQQWQFTPVTGGYVITMPMGRPTCNTTLTTVACNAPPNPNQVTFGASSATPNPLQVWSVTSTTAPAPVTQILPDGNYYINSIGRAACGNFTTAVNACPGGRDVALAGPTTTGNQIWNFINVGTNLYNIRAIYRSTCDNYLSASDCAANFVDLIGGDDLSGRQEYLVTATTGGYTISMPQGRNGCETYLNAQACGGATGLSFATAATTALQTWGITPVNSAAG